MPFVGFVVNKVHSSWPVDATPQQVEQALAANPAVAALNLSGTTHTMTAQALLAAHTEVETLARADRAAIGRLQAAGGESLLVEVPLQRDDVHDVERLVALEQWLLI
jgi:hypothetical protein